MARPRSRDEKIFAAAVLRRSMELGGDRERDGFRFVYEGVLRDLGLTDDEVGAYLVKHAIEVDAAIGRRRP